MHRLPIARSAALAGAGLGVAVLFISVFPPDLGAQSKDLDQKQLMREAMEKAKKFTEPGKNHQFLRRFLGNWTTETRLYMGPNPSPPEQGTAESTWLMDGRWLRTTSKGSLMGRPFESSTIFGYDNFKQSFVLTTVTNMDTAMFRAEGDLDPSGKALLTYGTLDEYLTGEHDKMVKTVFRFPSDDRMVMEIHDLPIGEHNTKVLEVTYTRKR